MESATGSWTSVDEEHLLALALARPAEAMRSAEALLIHPDPLARSVALQAIGIVHRERGESGPAVTALRRSVRLAKNAGSANRMAEAVASLGVALALTGRVRPGLDHLDEAARLSTGRLRGRVLMRRGTVNLEAGRFDAALADFRRSVDLLRRAGDRLWEARALQNRALTHVAQGAAWRADVDLEQAQEIFGDLGQDLETAFAVHNRALAAAAGGDLPRALELLDAAKTRYDELQITIPELAVDSCAVALAAGLAHEAVVAIADAITVYEARSGNRLPLAQMLLAASAAYTASGDHAAAVAAAQRAKRMFARNGQTHWSLRAETQILQVRWAQGIRRRADALRAADLADRLGRDVTRAASVHLLAARLSSACGLTETADAHFQAAARRRRRGPALSRSAGWLAHALGADARSKPGTMLTACDRGLRAVEEHLNSLGDAELRAHATAYGDDLAGLAARAALAAHDPAALLAWTERWRAITLHLPGSPARTDPKLHRDLSALREISRRCDLLFAADEPIPPDLDRERRRLEEAVRQRSRSSPGGHDSPTHRSDATRFTPPPDTTFLSIVSIDDELHAVVVDDAGFRLVRIGEVTRADDEAAFALHLLRRIAVGRIRSEHAAELLDQTAERLQEALLGPAADELKAERIVVVPPSRLHGVPWGLLPALSNRAFTVSPSLAMWDRAGTIRPPTSAKRALIAGPDLASDGAEVHRLAQAAPRGHATILAGDAATVERAIAAMDGAWLVHIAAHGTFRADSPMFSALQLADGPLTVYDLQRMRRAPYRLVLSSCESGASAAIGADELLGIESALLSLGSAGLLLSVTLLNDDAAVDLSMIVHQMLEREASLGEALLDARRVAHDDSRLRAAAACLIAVGR